MVSKPARNRQRARRVIQFIERLIVLSGLGAGGPLRLRSWQQAFFRDGYEPKQCSARRVLRRAVLSVGHKNGKSALTAALVLAHLVGPEAIRNGEIYSAATEREQVAIVLTIAAQMVRADREFLAMIRIVDSTKTMVCMHNGSIYRAISAEAGTKHGLNPSVVIYDELAQARTRDLYDVLDAAMGARDEPRFVVISTSATCFT